MIDKEVIKTMMAAVAGVIRDHVSAAVVPLTQRFEEYEKRLDAIRIPEAIKGDPGESIRGEKGDAGASAYEIAKDLGFTGTPAEWLASLRGADGITIRGEKGDSIAGPKGDDGRPGLTAYEIAVEEGFRGSKFDWLQSLKGADGVTIRGEKGDKGDAIQPDYEAIRRSIETEVRNAVAAIPPPKDGKDAEPVRPETLRVLVLDEVRNAVASIPLPKDGNPGKDADPVEVKRLIASAVAELPPVKDGLPGKDGKDGESIHPDTIRLMIRKEIDEIVSQIPRPQDGRSGEPGRDAAQIDILPSIDTSKSVPRGTYAFHDGGLIRSRRQTTVGETLDLNEWDVIVRGVSGIEFKQDTSDERRFTATVRLSDGETKETHFRIPVLAFRDVFKEGTVYERGDVVRWDHSSWHCSAEKTKGTPGISPDWKLLVKRGDRGRDGKDLEAPKPPAPIRLNGGGR